jgi:ABC-type Na+ efflux pump permease subunit
VGEKERNTLETLLYSPLTLGQLFNAKIFASFIMSMIVSLISFGLMLAVVELLCTITLGTLIIPALNWLVMMCLASPALSLIAIALIVRGSAKAQSIEDAQQRSIFLLIPIMLLIANQFMGIMVAGLWIFFGIGVVFALIAFALLKSSYGNFQYETLLR